MNPDGFSLGRRGNLHHVDLNRNFPDQFRDPVDSTANREPETVAMMNFIRSRHFTLSANFHGGSVVANYPFDGNESGDDVYSKSSDDDIFRYLSLEYSMNHLTMHNSTEFPQGITNGAAWYVLYGGMQDWNYLYQSCFEITLEVSENKWPSIEEIPSFWEENLPAMLAYLKAVHMGVKGFVYSSDKAEPLYALIRVEGFEIGVTTDKENGDYYRLLLPGTYSVTASAPNYKTQTHQVTVEPGKPTVLNFHLDYEKNEKPNAIVSVNSSYSLSNVSITVVLTIAILFSVITVILVIWFIKFAQKGK